MGGDSLKSYSLKNVGTIVNIGVNLFRNIVNVF